MHPATLALIAAIATSACASSPGSIAPIPVNPERYAGLSCTALMAEHVRVSDALREASERQSAAATGDTIGVLLILLPVSSLTGNDNQGRVAQLKGENDALRIATMTRGCGTERQSQPQSSPGGALQARYDERIADVDRRAEADVAAVQASCRPNDRARCAAWVNNIRADQRSHVAYIRNQAALNSQGATR